MICIKLETFRLFFPSYLADTVDNVLIDGTFENVIDWSETDHLPFITSIITPRRFIFTSHPNLIAIFESLGRLNYQLLKDCACLYRTNATLLERCDFLPINYTERQRPKKRSVDHLHSRNAFSPAWSLWPTFPVNMENYFTLHVRAAEFFPSWIEHQQSMRKEGLAR